MDSVTQFALGAAVSAALLGPRIGARKAVVLGGVLGTLPDLDTFLPAADSVQAFTGHRGWSHSLIVQAALTPLFAEPLVRLSQPLRDSRIRTYLAVYLVFATHALIDAMTVYGTRLFWPVIEDPVGVGSIFIIDPLYTLPLLVPVLWGLFKGGWTPRYARTATVALAVSTAYMAATVPLQSWMTARAATWLAAKGFEAQRLIAIPTPFNVLYWRTIAVGERSYVNLYMPVLGGAADAYVHATRPDLAGCLTEDPTFRTLAAFTKGFFRMENADGRVIFSDLRMGLTPRYVFRFQLGEIADGGVRPVYPPVREETQRGADGDIAWLLAGIAADPVRRPAEDAAYAGTDVGLAAPKALAAYRCPAPTTG